MDDATYDDLSGRLLGLLINVEDRLSPEMRDGVAEYVDAGEFGLALEMMADELSEYDHPVTSRERFDFLELVRRMEMDGRVEECFALCPDRP